MRGIPRYRPAMRPSLRERTRKVFYFFPFQLLFLHLKRNHLILALWLILFGIVTQQVGQKFGLPYLFLYPEYLGRVDFLSHAVLGFSCGGFIMAFNMHAYVTHGFKFRFIATVSRPFAKFSYNNFLIPAFFVITYLISAVRFQVNKELEDPAQVMLNMMGFLFGMFVFFFFSMYYFFKTNKDLFKLSGRKEEEFDAEYAQKAVEKLERKRKRWADWLDHEEGWTVETYLSGPWRIRIARDARHYDIDLIKRVFAQNHLNASIFEAAMIISFLSLGLFKEIPFFLIPAGASVFLLLTIILMIISAIYSWFRGWTITVIIIGSLFVNYLSQTTELFAYKNFAYGLDYANKKKHYSAHSIEVLANNKANYDEDKRKMLDILNRWKLDYESRFEKGAKPKLVLIATSGGGLRSALWTYQVLQVADSVCDGELFANARMISGSSGGMIGAAYFRELYLQKKQGKNLQLGSKHYKENISDDILNPVSFTIATSDLFVRFQKFKDGPYSYTKDRGYIFEKYLDRNLDSVFSTKRLYDYRVPEENADIPMMVFSPVIINHGRKLIISSQPVSYFSYLRPDGNVNSQPSYGNIEFSRFFHEQNGQNVKFTSVLRMNATFPYVMPMVTLPTDPVIEVMDAGIRDNYGVHLNVKFIHEFKNWIEHNTSGVVLLNVRDRQKEVDFERVNGSMYRRMIIPASNILDNIFFTQDFDNEELIYYLKDAVNFPVECVDVCLRHDARHKVSLSWHLTRLERNKVLNSVDFPENQSSLKKLRSLLAEPVSQKESE